MNKGYVKVPRGVLEKIPVDRGPFLFSVYMKLYFGANYSDTRISWCGKPHTLKKGQLKRSVDELALLVGGKTDATMIRRALKKLEELDLIHQDSRRFGRLITILDFDCEDLREEEAEKEPELPETESVTCSQLGANDVTNSEDLDTRNDSHNAETPKKEKPQEVHNLSATQPQVASPLYIKNKKEELKNFSLPKNRGSSTIPELESVVKIENHRKALLSVPESQQREWLAIYETQGSEWLCTNITAALSLFKDHGGYGWGSKIASFLIRKREDWEKAHSAKPKRSKTRKQSRKSQEDHSLNVIDLDDRRNKRAYVDASSMATLLWGCANSTQHFSPEEAKKRIAAMAPRNGDGWAEFIWWFVDYPFGGWGEVRRQARENVKDSQRVKTEWRNAFQARLDQPETQTTGRA